MHNPANPAPLHLHFQPPHTTTNPAKSCERGPQLLQAPYWAPTRVGLLMHPGDKVALEAFRDAMTSDAISPESLKLASWKHLHPLNLLANWNDDYHPCQWCGVFCECNTLYPGFVKPSCTMDPEVERVHGLDFGSGVRPASALAGTIPSELGSLTESFLMYLHGNALMYVCPSDLLTPLPLAPRSSLLSPVLTRPRP